MILLLVLRSPPQRERDVKQQVYFNSYYFLKKLLRLPCYRIIYAMNQKSNLSAQMVIFQVQIRGCGCAECSRNKTLSVTPGCAQEIKPLQILLQLNNKQNRQPDNSKPSRSEEDSRRYKNTCPSYAFKIALPFSPSWINCRCLACVSLKAEAKICGMFTKKVHSCKDRAIESKRRENEKRRKKVIKISGRHWRGQTSKQQQRPHQYENEPAVTVAAIRLP